MKYQVKSSILAKADRQRITKYLAQYSTSAPEKFKQELKRYLDLIGEQPNLFAVFPANPNYRHVVVFGSYSLFYTVNETGKTVWVYRILHAAQNTEGML